MPESPNNVANRESSETASLALWTALEDSLQSSQRALLERDVEGLETATAEQRRLLKAIYSAGGLCEDLCQRLPNGTEKAAALHSVQRSVQSLARVQHALLERAQRSLLLVSNLVAGAQASYSKLPGQPGICVHPATVQPHLFSSKET